MAPCPGDPRRNRSLTRPTNVTRRQLLPQIELPGRRRAECPDWPVQIHASLRLHPTSLLAPLLSMPPVSAAGSSSYSFIQDLLLLVYFGSLFDIKPQREFIATMVARQHERSSYIIYDYVGDDAVGLLVENDLDVVYALPALAVARPASAVRVSHRDALQACAHHARLWLTVPMIRSTQIPLLHMLR